jgi:transcriptional regulator with XRE-family HTH domain
MPQFSDAFSQVVRKHRETQKLSRRALAQKAGLHQTYIGLLERGDRSPNLDTAKAIAEALGIPLSRLIAQSEKTHRR